MKFLPQSLRQLELERQQLEDALGEKTMQLAGERATDDAAVLAIATKMIEAEHAVFRRLPVRALRTMQADMQARVDELNVLGQADGIGEMQALVLRAESMQLEARIRRITSHIDLSPKPTSVKEAVLVFGFVATAVVAFELLKSWL